MVLTVDLAVELDKVTIQMVLKELQVRVVTLHLVKDMLEEVHLAQQLLETKKRVLAEVELAQ
jgi:hypothetical protein